VHETTVPARRSLSPAEKQLIHALLQDPEIARTLEPCLEFLSEAWSLPVLENLIKDPARNVETILGPVQDEELRKEVRAAILEPFARITREQAFSSMGQLYQEQLVKKEREIRDQLRQYGAGAAPPELVRKQMEIVAEKSRIRDIKP
jgi:hypothetical protein